ncbi:hypothetical protein AB7W88_00030 [Providencia vermicola]|uniref:Uncharacterized protein n=4 Tax=Providencia TaxID=586 RepID=A0AAI9HWA3_PROST|nr:MULTISPECIES: hypothetical protein [Providencia]ELR5046490.1 hypothetical protein [Providencia rettgeri]MTC07645.1 hypothetical protein [Providencia sp. wls1948]ELR5033943.1 hypothetical protein [Providencia stuartii]ELR5119691.1 hypothetical protein [Providencia stuartii]ELR5141435.1 hypothetical protein [Providencia stuartii]
MKSFLLILTILCSSAFAAYATETVTWCPPNPSIDPLTGEAICINYTPGIGGIDSGGEGP